MTMTTIHVRDDLVKTLRLFGDAESVVSDALKRYAIQQCIERIDQAVNKAKAYEARYKCDYQTFSTRVQTDDDFLRTVEAVNPTWEEDAMEWEMRLREVETWTKRLEDTLRK